MSQELKDFLGRFNFRKRNRGLVGVEREHFLASRDRLSPRAEAFLQVIKDPLWTYELSACQVESRTRPKRDALAIQLELLKNWNNGVRVASRFGLDLVNCEVCPEDMPLMVFPDPRYLKIVKSLSSERLLAACRVTGTHIHLGMPSIDEAIRIYNILIQYLDALCKLGDHSGGERLRLYKGMAVDWSPEPYENAEHFFHVARARGFEDNPRNCWHLIRISRHGTIELRMFGVTDHIDEIIYWISYARSLIK